MTEFYLYKIKHDMMSLEGVPSLWYNKVKAELEKENTVNE